MAFIDIEVRKLDTLIRMAKKNDTPTYKVAGKKLRPFCNNSNLIGWATL